MSTKKFRAVITDADYVSHQPECEVLSNLNVDLVKFQCKNEEDVIKNCKDADALLVQYAPITRKVIESMKNLKIIARYGIGVDNVDLEAASEKGVFVTNVAYDMCDVADHTISLMLCLIRKIPWIYQSTKSGEWDWKKFRPIVSVKGKTIGIVGLGRAGREVARRLSGFEVSIIAYDPYVTAQAFEKNHIRKVDLEGILAKSDVITLHVALSKETTHIIGESELRKMKKNAILINTCRGPVVDERALYNALKEGRIAGAGLDVLENEPLTKDSPLLQLNNVIITPHIAWYSEGSVIEIQRATAQEVARVLRGLLPTRIVNKEALQAKKR